MTNHRYFNRIMERFGVLFGNQKMASVFQGVSDATAEAWEAQLRETDPEVVKQALKSLADNPPEWPPALAEWIKLCKQFNRPEHRAALPPPPHAPTDVGRQMQSEIRNVIEKPGYDYLMWAKQPGSAKAVELLVRGAREDRRLRDILDHLIATDGRDCRGEEARRAIRALPASVRGQLAPA